MLSGAAHTFQKRYDKPMTICFRGLLRPTLLQSYVVFIRDGLYAAVDIMLESNLDVAVGPDLGFLAPFDCMVRH